METNVENHTTAEEHGFCPCQSCHLTMGNKLAVATAPGCEGQEECLPISTATQGFILGADASLW